MMFRSGGSAHATGMMLNDGRRCVNVDVVDRDDDDNVATVLLDLDEIVAFCRELLEGFEQASIATG